MQVEGALGRELQIVLPGKSLALVLNCQAQPIGITQQMHAHLQLAVGRVLRAPFNLLVQTVLQHQQRLFLVTDAKVAMLNHVDQQLLQTQPCASWVGAGLRQPAGKPVRLGQG